MLRALLALVSSLALSAAASAQCVPYGTPCTSGMEALCVSPPQIGTLWQVGERNGSNCGNPTAMFTLIGGCVSPGVPISPPLACTACGTCEWQVIPILVAWQWTWPPRVTAIPIPFDRTLVGGVFCIQNLCANPTTPCVCLSGAVQVTVQP